MNLLEKFQEQRDNFDNLTQNASNFTANVGSFQKNVLMISTLILVILLVTVGILMLNSKKQEFPPHISPCPDYWVNSNFFQDNSNGGRGEDAYNKVTGSGIKSLINSIPDDEKNSYCINMHNIGDTNCPKGINFSTDEYKGTNGDCKKRDWAKKCNLTWDGITNNAELKDC